MDVENSSRTGGCFEWNTTQKEDGKSGSYSMTTNEKHALKSVAQSWRKRWDCNRFQTMENTLTRFQFAKSLSRKNIFHRFSISSLPPLPPFKDPCVPPLARSPLSSLSSFWLRNFLFTHLATLAETRIFIIDKIKIPSTVVNTSPSRLSLRSIPGYRPR